MHDVFVKGDTWLSSGDLMRQDAEGFFYFVDRVGDTFRWKGEKLATTEVAAAMLSCPDIQEAVVYGVAVPGTEGKAGMTAIAVDPHLDIDGLSTHLAARLPEYACPLFLRV
jgi:fatty-acyl-CoA synthase